MREAPGKRGGGGGGGGRSSSVVVIARRGGGGGGVVVVGAVVGVFAVIAVVVVLGRSSLVPHASALYSGDFHEQAVFLFIFLLDSPALFLRQNNLVAAVFSSTVQGLCVAATVN